MEARAHAIDPASVEHIGRRMMLAAVDGDAFAVQFIVPGAPVPKARARVFAATMRVRGGGRRTVIRAATPARTVAFEKQVGHYARAAMATRAPFPGAVAVCVECIFAPAPSASKRRTAAMLDDGWHTHKPDADNVSKAVKDALRGIVFDDDAQVAILLVVKRYGTEACTRVSARTIDAPFSQWSADVGLAAEPITH